MTGTSDLIYNKFGLMIFFTERSEATTNVMHQMKTWCIGEGDKGEGFPKMKGLPPKARLDIFWKPNMKSLHLLQTQGRLTYGLVHSKPLLMPYLEKEEEEEEIQVKKALLLSMQFHPSVLNI